MYASECAQVFLSQEEFYVLFFFFSFLTVENQKVQLTEGSRSHHSINCTSTRTPVTKELNYNLDTHTSTGRLKAAEKKDACNVENSRKKEMEILGTSSKNDSIPEVEALLARLRAL